MIGDKRRKLNENLAEVRNSANSETKSSAGDKHETGRALAQLEQENLGKQLVFIDKLEAAMLTISEDQELTKVEHGSLMTTDKLTVLFGPALGEVTANKKKVFVISMASPLGVAANHLTVGQSFKVNGITHSIKAIQ